VKHPAALDNDIWAFQQVLRVDGAEVALTGPEHHGCDVHAHLVDQPSGKQLPTDVPAATSTMRSPASSRAVATAASMPSTK
jgi:hypothetical protein